MSRLLRFLRSPRLAAALLVGLTAYAWLTTLIPLESGDPKLASSWDASHPLLAPVVRLFGLHHAYSSPAFVVAAVLLIASTAVCSYDRTRQSIRAVQRRTSSWAPALKRVESSPMASIALTTGDAAAVTSEASAVLRRLRMRVEVEGDVVAARSGSIGLLGSPVFHWGLVGLFLFAGLGQLTRYEGVGRVVAGTTIIDDASSAYNERYSKGLLAWAPSSGARITVDRIAVSHVVDGIERGPAPYVTVRRGGAVKRQWVYSNRPLTMGSIAVHAIGSAPALVASVSMPGASKPREITLHFKNARIPTGFQLTNATSGAATNISVAGTSGQNVRVTASGEFNNSHVVGVGESVPVGGGISIGIKSLTSYASLVVVNDWSIPWIYAMLSIASLAATLTVFAPPRAVWLKLARRGEGSDGSPITLRLLISARKSDPAFARQVETALREHFEHELNVGKADCVA